MADIFRKYWPLFFISTLFLFPKMTFAASWTSVGFPGRNVQTIYVSPKNNNKMLIGLAGGMTTDRNYITENGGQTWAPISMSGVANCNQFAVNPKLETEYWAACTNGLYHSTDGGKSFSRMSRYTTNILTVLVTSNGKIYVTYTNNGADYSYDGSFWQPLTVPGVGSQPFVYVNKYNENQVFVSKNGYDLPGLYRSNDGGLTWMNVYNISPVRMGVYSMVFLENGAKICATTGTGFGCSLDAGITWSAFTSPNPTKPSEPEHSFQAIINPDDATNILVFAIGWNGLDGRIYSYESGNALPKIYDTPQFTGYITISQGVVFAGAQDSTKLKGLWRNDGVVVVPEYLKKHPVIIVPGILGSWFLPSTGKWALDPVLKTYDDIYFSFVNAGYEPDKDIFTFPYQWRNDNRYTAGLLANKIKEIKQKSGADKVDIVAHSMGGLVTRFYAQSDIYDNDINQIFFLGTPQLGSTGAYPIWEAGFTGYEEAFFGTFLRFVLVEEAITNRYFGEYAVRNYIQNEVTSVKQTLPVYSYLNSEIYPVRHPVNSELESLNNTKGLLASRRIRIINFIGDTGPSTIGGLSVASDSEQPLWEYGAPIGLKTGNIYDGVSFVHGDGTVSVESQSLIPGENYILSGVEHNDIPKFSIQKIFEELGINNNPVITDSISKILMIKAYSPVDFYVLAPDGNKIGFNRYGEAFDEITGAFYTGNDTETEFLTIPNPLPGEYKVMTYGTGAGSYQIEATYANDETNDTITSSYTGQTTPGKEDKLLVELSPVTGTIETKIDDKNAPNTTATLEGNKVNEYYNTDVLITLSASDTESGVKKTEYSLDNIVWQDYTNPIILSQDGEVTISYRSVDQAENIETPQTLTLKIDKTAPTVVINLNKTNFTHWDMLNIDCSTSDNYSGISSFVMKLDESVIDCEKPVNLFDQTFGNHKIEYVTVDIAGNVTAGEKTYLLVANFGSTLRDIAWLYDNKHFKNRGEAVSVAVHVELAWLFDILGMSKKTASSLNQAVSLLDKQVTKNKITSYGYDMITRDIKYILEGR